MESQPGASAAAADESVGHPKGGPLPTLLSIYHPRLAAVIQEARGRIHDGVHPLEVGEFIADQMMGDKSMLTRSLLRIAIAYLIGAAEDKSCLGLMSAIPNAGVTEGSSHG